MSEPKRGGGSPLLYIILLIVGIGVGGAGVWFLFSKGKLPGAASQTTSAGNGVRTGKAEKKIKYWQAPMDPAYIRDEPGKSPMGMDLIPVYDEGDDDKMEAGTVKIDPVTIQNIGVRTERVERKTLTKTVRTVGIVDYDEKRVYHVNTKIEGWVEKLYVDFTGQKVNKDDYLLEIYSPKLVATQEEYLLAKSYQEKAGGATDLPGGGSVLELAKKRLELWDVPRHQIRELEESGVIKKTIHVHSPARGIVVKKNVKEGMFVKPGINLYTIADLSRVWVYADVYEYEMAWVKVGQEAEMVLAAYPGRVFMGKVTFINPFMEPKTRTVKVRLEFDNTEGMLKPDMFANVMLKSRLESAAVAVPVEAVLLSGERSVVMVARGGGKFTPKEVTLGVEAGGYYEVIGGLKAGEEVVTSAHFLIDSESRLKEAISKMLELKNEDSGSTGMEGMDHSGMEGMDQGSTEHEGMDHGAMKHEGMDHTGMEDMDQGSMEHKGMDHGSMNHGGMDR
jgi:Cu(I)/Ag(I) efflux system membrane fusion protein